MIPTQCNGVITQRLACPLPRSNGPPGVGFSVIWCGYRRGVIDDLVWLCAVSNEAADLDGVCVEHGETACVVTVPATPWALTP